MKKLAILGFVVTTICASSLIISCSKVANVPQTNNSGTSTALQSSAKGWDGIIVRVPTKTEFGAVNPNGGCNSGSGCKVTTYSNPLVVNPGTGWTSGEAGLNSNNHLVLSFRKEFMSQTWKDYFEDGSMDIQATLVVGSDVMDQLTGVENSSYVISAGTYSYDDDEEYYYVTF
ncbi:MAG: hypothetical protein J0L80_15800 [Chitinophagales bacterium]|nr:hypothetical protein [Chitinophagales bacterium]